MEPFVVVGSFIVGAVLFLLWSIRPKRVSSDVPGPKRTRLLGLFEIIAMDGAEGDMDWSHWPTYGLQMARKYSFRTWGGPTPNIGFGGAMFSVISPLSLEYILRTNCQNYVKGNLTKGFRELMGEAVFTSDGDKWKFHRKIVVSVLGKDAVSHGASLLKAKLISVGSWMSAREGEVIDIQDLANKMIFDVFLKLAFGVEVDQIHGVGSAESDVKEFIRSFDALQECTHLRMDDFLWEYKQYFGLGERERAAKRHKAIIDKFAYTIIGKTKQIADLSERRDVVSRFIQFSRDRREQEPSDEELRDYIMTLVMAGRDTTAAALSWTLWELTRHPVCIDAIREECDSLDELDEHSKLPYTTSVIMESLRLHCPAPELFRFAVKEDTLPDGTFIPEGSLVMYSAYSANRNPQVWGVDVDEFVPNRWIDMGEPNPFKFPTFNAGPRMCPGKSLAMMELKLSVAYLISRFDFADPFEHNGEYKFTLILRMKDGFPVKVYPRARAN